MITGRSQDPRKRFAEELHKLRLARRLSCRALGAAVGWDPTLFSKMERGKTLGGPEVVKALDTFYQLPEMLLALWEVAVGDRPPTRMEYRQYFDLEAEAVSIWEYAVCLLPGLLQTERYARRLMEQGSHEGEELERQIKLRLERQEVLKGADAVTFRAILSETVLRTPLPDPTHWQEQLEHLLTVSDQRNVTLQVLPHSAGPHALNSTNVTFLRLTDARVVAWVETGFSGTQIDASADVEHLQARYDDVRDLALSPAESRRFIMRMLEKAQREQPA
ncbi:helix-turn-helix transcriptional regulator [Streptomyces showdoensis]|uniref:helix-turn-helix domain-containing protein n=1 Tax=Streptomyces showdoensis TaxID=68268 RepID=UPI0031EBE7D5